MSGDESHGTQIEHRILFLRVFVINLMINNYISDVLDLPRMTKHGDTQVYGSVLPKSIDESSHVVLYSLQDLLCNCFKRRTSKSKKPKRNFDSAISYEETPFKKKSIKAKKDVTSIKKPATKPKLTKKKALVKADRCKSLNVLSEGDSREEKDDDDDEDETKDDEDNNDGDDSDDDDDDNDSDDDNNDGNVDDDSDHERTESDRDENPNLNQSNEEHEEEEENID
nr:hypothetical protein [Tanacetum cinerariifolium]